MTFFLSKALSVLSPEADDGKLLLPAALRTPFYASVEDRKHLRTSHIVHQKEILVAFAHFRQFLEHHHRRLSVTLETEAALVGVQDIVRTARGRLLQAAPPNRFSKKKNT